MEDVCTWGCELRSNTFLSLLVGAEFNVLTEHDFDCGLEMILSSRSVVRYELFQSGRTLLVGWRSLCISFLKIKTNISAVERWNRLKSRTFVAHKTCRKYEHHPSCRHTTTLHRSSTWDDSKTSATLLNDYIWSELLVFIWQMRISTVAIDAIGGECEQGNRHCKESTAKGEHPIEVDDVVVSNRHCVCRNSSGCDTWNTMEIEMKNRPRLYVRSIFSHCKMHG